MGKEEESRRRSSRRKLVDIKAINVSRGSKEEYGWKVVEWSVGHPHEINELWLDLANFIRMCFPRNFEIFSGRKVRFL